MRPPSSADRSLGARVLVTCDDGIDAPGLMELAGAMVAAGHQPVVAAPASDHSGAGTGLQFPVGQPIPLRHCTRARFPGVPFISVPGSPALTVLLARLGAFGPAPSWVAAGINHGANTGRSVLHSGTVGAALTASSLGMSALAVSIDAEQPRHLATAAAVAQAAAVWLARARKRTVLNVNVPDLPLPCLRGARWARLAAYGASRAFLAEAGEGHVVVQMAAGGLPLDPGTDAGLLAAGFAAITPITGVQAQILADVLLPGETLSLGGARPAD